jgi:hypothetical protein
MDADMRLAAATYAFAVLSTAPALAQDAPVGIFRCHDTSMAPFGTLLLDGQGTYQIIGTSTADWAADPALPQNGAGTYSIDGTQLQPEGGPLKDAFAATGNFLGGGQEATIGFSDKKGALLTCLSTVG